MALSSQWKCFTFSLSDDATSDEQDSFRKRTESMIRHLSETVAQQKTIVDDLNKKAKEKKDRLRREREAKQKSEIETKEEKQSENLNGSQPHDSKANAADVTQQILQEPHINPKVIAKPNPNDQHGYSRSQPSMPQLSTYASSPALHQEKPNSYFTAVFNENDQNEEKESNSQLKTDDVWSCTVCTFWNNLTLPQCELCGAKKAANAPIVKVQ